jgi:hypothetical protein
MKPGGHGKFGDVETMVMNHLFMARGPIPQHVGLTHLKGLVTEALWRFHRTIEEGKVPVVPIHRNGDFTPHAFLPM